MATPEATLRAAVLKRIREDYPPSRSGVLVFGRPAGPSTGPGHPDLFGVALGRFLALEIKQGKEKPTPLQIERIHDLRRAGAYAWIIRSTLDATRAVYQAKKGGPVPTPNDPIDFDDWFKTITSEPVATSTASADVSVTFDPPMPQTTGSVSNLVITTEQDVAPESPAEEDEDVGHEQSDLLDFPQPGEPQPEPESIQAEADRDYEAQLRSEQAPSWEDVLAAMANLDKILRAVGDRVTEVYEATNRIETLVRINHGRVDGLTQEALNVHMALDKILVEMGEESLPEPINEPTPLDDVLPAEKPKRGRPRKAS